MNGLFIMKKLPYWSDLPAIELYLDQVLIYVNDTTNLLFNTSGQKPLTASMVNNYVKHSYVKKPIKKKYGKTQLAQLIAISLLKEVFNIQVLTETMMTLAEQHDKENLFDAFTSCLNAENLENIDIPEVVERACATLKLYYSTLDLLVPQEDTTHEHD
ncbi:DUF1836 domain-containing protein [Streptococcus merionis]|uniref:DUF1836 domain-containing protein n=1 Tax=Streptococcus merionis TaxID=400065 RepID=UPI0035177732